MAARCGGGVDALVELDAAAVREHADQGAVPSHAVAVSDAFAGTVAVEVAVADWGKESAGKGGEEGGAQRQGGCAWLDARSDGAMETAYAYGAIVR